MASVVSPANSAGESVDAGVTAASTTGVLRGIVTGTARAVAGGDSNVGASEIGTHLDDAAFTPAGTTAVVVIGGFADDTSPDSVNEGDAGAVRMSLARAMHVVNVCDVATVTSVASQDTNITLLAANANRIGATIYNTDSGPLFVKFGATATATTSFTVRIVADGYYEFPQPVYRGIVDGIWTTSSTGAANITELT